MHGQGRRLSVDVTRWHVFEIEHGQQACADGGREARGRADVVGARGLGRAPEFFVVGEILSRGRARAVELRRGVVPLSLFPRARRPTGLRTRSTIGGGGPGPVGGSGSDRRKGFGTLCT